MTTTPKQFNEVMDRLEKVRETKAVTMQGGRRYTQVVDRMEQFRRVFGDEYGLSTEIIYNGMATGESVLVKATIKDREGRAVATGHAEEIRSGRGVNFTSAVENAETSAIGRALAVLGFSGGEFFASANEVDAVERKEEAKKAPRTATKPAAAPSAPPEEETPLREPGDETTTNLDIRPSSGDWSEIERAQWDTTARSMIMIIEKATPSIKALVETHTKNLPVLEAMEVHAPANHDKVMAAFTARKEQLKKKD